MASYQNILFCRTDRLGDVLLSTPALRALRKAYPEAWISMLVSPVGYPAVENNPDVNELLVFDKKASWRDHLRLWRRLRERRFDVAVIAHCTNAVNALTGLAGIPDRIGYARKAGYWLTRPLPNLKAQGDKHEADYVLDLVERIGAQAAGRKPLFYFTEQDSDFAAIMLKKMGMKPDKPLIALHAGSSAPSKRWPKEYFAALLYKLAAESNLQTILVGGAEEMALSQEILPRNAKNIVDFTGLLNVPELGAMLARCALFVSNDSGPVHLSVAVGTPTLALFGRNQPGLGPRTWGPLGEGDRVLQKDVGCTECLADDCKIAFKCLTELGVEEVHSNIQDMLSMQNANCVLARK